MAIFDRNYYLAEHFSELIDVCQGDEELAKDIRKILRRSYRNQREQNYRPRKYRLTVIDGQLNRILSVSPPFKK